MNPAAKAPTAAQNAADLLDQSRYAASEGKTVRQSASGILLLLKALGGPRQWSGKLTRLLRTLTLYLNRAEIKRRWARLQKQGYVQQVPTVPQLFAGGLDMVRFFISPGAADYYATRGINFTFHQVLRFLDDPVSMVDPVGILSERDTIIGHLLQVVHANPAYDVQILDMFEDGVDALEKQTRQMIDGSHPRALSIGAIVEDPEYHQRLLDWIVAWRKDPNVPEMRRRAGSARSSRDFVLAEETFGTLPGAMRYFNRLPATWLGALRHMRDVQTTPAQYCDPAVVKYVDGLFANATVETT